MSSDTLMGATFPYRTKVEQVQISGITLEIEQLISLDETIDEFFQAYEKSGDEALFGDLAPYFGTPWPAGLALASYALSRSEAWMGASVLEIGCGLALPSLVLAKAGLSRIQASDLHPDVPVFLRANCRRNRVNVEFVRHDWQEPGEGAQVILGSDLVYDRTQPEALIGFLKRVVWNEAVFADPGRPYWEGFVQSAKKYWDVEESLRDGILFARFTGGFNGRH